MSVVLPVLESQLAQGVATARRLAAGEPMGEAATQALAALGAELRRVLRRFDTLDAQRAALQARAAAEPGGPAAHGAASFDAELGRVWQRALRLSAQWLAWRRRSGLALPPDAVAAVHHVALVHGRVLPPMLVRSTAQRVASQADPLAAGLGLPDAALTDATYAALALAAAWLAPTGSLA